MDEVTLEMTRLLKARTDIALRIGRLKEDAGIPVSDESREGNLRQKIVSLCGEIGLEESIATRHLNFLLNESVSTQSVDRQTHLSIFHKAKELERQGQKIIHMEVGEPDFAPPKIVGTALSEACSKGYTRYGRARGRQEVLDALARHVSEKFHPTPQENVMVSPGARFAIYSAITTLLSPGDEIIIIEPAWPAYRECALNSGIKIRAIATTLEDRWEPDPGRIEDVTSPNTKMIILNYPNNPTGKILPEKLQDDIVEIAVKNNLYILSDEIYSTYSKNWKSILSYEYQNSIITQSFSKSHAMTGLRIGYAIAHNKIIDRISKLAALCLTSISEPIQYAAMKALEADTSEFADTMQRRLDVMSREAGRIGLEFASPDGAMYLFARTGIDGARLADEALRHGLAVAPGEGFGRYGDYIRISACQNEKTLIDGMNILSGLIGEYR
ncbi:MAG: aminotransferase class I/II-fold pyridoxal phosphate-dependent enzyme [Nitrosopumilus sp. B06]|nr:MAG: aminotransferase class I/II-fold pyridoxal phosphate-dependent enzyme [Nitrosopumilus sp. B06]